MSGHWQRRWQPLLQQWVIIAANSAQRPWSGALTDNKTSDNKQTHDPGCYLCPRVTRASGNTNPDYKGAFAFDNDFPTLAADAPDIQSAASTLPTADTRQPKAHSSEERQPDSQPSTHQPAALHASADQASVSQPSVLQKTDLARGRCRVLCWSENHADTLASLDANAMIKVAHLWKTEYENLSTEPDIAQVLIFENKGVEIGVSNLHPHGQIYATNFVTDTAVRQRSAQADYFKKFGHTLLQHMLAEKHVQQNLLVEQNQHWSVIVPFAARFSYETWIIPHRHLPSLAQATDDELSELALCYQRQVRRYDVLFERSAPNISLLHNAPCDKNEDNQHWCFHLAFHPPLRDSQKLKYLAGFESGSNNIVNPMMPEHAASILRDIAQGQQS